MIEHSFINGMYLRHVRSHNPAGTIVYIHGLGESGLCFERMIVDSKLQTWSHLVPDLPGYGKSPWLEQPKGLQGHAEKLGHWLKSIRVGKMLLIGHSMGGVVGMVLCEKHPQLFHGFINIEGNVSFDDCIFSGKVAAYSLQDLMSYGLETIYDNIYRGGLEDPALRSYYASLRLCDPRAYHLNSKELVELSRMEEIPGRLANLNLPCLYILGNPRGISERSKKLLVDAGVGCRAVENAGHWTFIDQRGAVIEEVLRFIRDLPSI